MEAPFSRSSLHLWITLAPLVALPSYLVRSSAVPFNLLDLLLVLAIGINLPLFIKRHRSWGWLEALGVLLVIAGCMSTAIAPDTKLALGALKSWIILPVCYALVVAPYLRKSYWPLLLPQAVLASLYGIAHFSASVVPDRLTSWYDSPNFFAMAVVPVVLLSTAWLTEQWKAVSPWVRTAVLVGLLICGGALLLSKSLGGLTALAIGLIVLFFLRLGLRWVSVGIVALALAASIVVPLVVPVGSPSEPYSVTLAGRSESAKARSQIWAVARIAVVQHPILGIGLRQFGSTYTETIEQVTGYPVERIVPQPHNLPFALILNLGLLGAIVVLTLIIKTAASNDAAAVAVVAALLTHGILDTPLFTNDYSLIFLCVVAAALARPRTVPQ